MTVLAMQRWAVLITVVAFELLTPPARAATHGSLLSSPLMLGLHVHTMAIVCREESPGMSGHLNQAYRNWVRRNTDVAQAEQELGLDADAPTESPERKQHEVHREELLEKLRRELQRDAEAFGERCNEFVKDLASNKLDYRR